MKLLLCQLHRQCITSVTCGNMFFLQSFLVPSFHMISPGFVLIVSAVQRQGQGTYLRTCSAVPSHAAPFLLKDAACIRQGSSSSYDVLRRLSNLLTSSLLLSASPRCITELETSTYISCYVPLLLASRPVGRASTILDSVSAISPQILQALASHAPHPHPHSDDELCSINQGR